MIRGNLINPSLPSGVKDILPLEAKELKLIKKRLAKVYESAGYDEVFAPTFEYLDVLSLQAGERIKKEMFKFLDDRGDLLALRPDMTTSIARLASQRLRDEKLPLRLYYQANVFRQQKPLQGQPREFWQSGIELIGGSQKTADTEIVILIIDSLKGLGLNNFKVGLSNIAFVKDLLNSLPKEESELRKYLAKKDLVSVEKILSGSKSSAASNFREAILLRGENALKEAKKIVPNEKAKSSLDELAKVSSVLKKEGYDKYTTYDLGLMPDFDYYTGLVFEVYVDGLGVAVASGGRYDNLLSSFGWDIAAAGFAFSLERLHMALIRQGEIR